MNAEAIRAKFQAINGSIPLADQRKDLKRNKKADLVDLLVKYAGDSVRCELVKTHQAMIAASASFLLPTFNLHCRTRKLMHFCRHLCFLHCFGLRIPITDWPAAKKVRFIMRVLAPH